MTKRKGCSVYTRSYTPHCISTDWEERSVQIKVVVCALPMSSRRIVLRVGVVVSMVGVVVSMVWSSTSGKGRIFLFSSKRYY